MKQKSLNLNMLLNAIKGLMAVIFPLITFPYVSRILGVESLGRYNFANSIVGYIILLAGLGIYAYSIREGARVREDKEKFAKFADQIFTINFLSTILAYIVLTILLLVVPKFQDYTALILILSSQIIFTVFGTEWMYSIYEEYAFITIRSIVFQIISIILLVLFVKTENDVNIYAIVSVVSASGANIFNYFYAKKYHRVKLTKNLDLKKHLKPILLIFVTAATVVVYLNSGTTILGFMSGDEAVGVYSVAMKVFTIVKNMVASVIIVSIPRVSALLGSNQRDILTKTIKSIYGTLMTVVVPAAFGIAVLSKEIVLLVSGEEYLAAAVPLAILAIEIVLNLNAYFWSDAILVPLKKEKVVLKITITSLLINVILNVILIPIYNATAPAIATLVSELFTFVMCMLYGRKLIGNIGGLKTAIKTIIGSLPIVAYAIFLKPVITNMYIYIVVLVALSGISYLVIELLLKNEVLYDILGKLKKKLVK